MTFREWKDNTVAKLREDLRHRGFTPEATDGLSRLFDEVIVSAHTMEFTDAPED